MDSIRVKILREGARLPSYGSAEAAGADLYACLSEAVTIPPGETVFLPTGIALEVPKGCGDWCMPEAEWHVNAVWRLPIRLAWLTVTIAVKLW